MMMNMMCLYKSAQKIAAAAIIKSSQQQQQQLDTYTQLIPSKVVASLPTARPVLSPSLPTV